MVVSLFNVVNPEAFKVDRNVGGLSKLLNVGGINISL
jgi:hypothetical protein